VEGTENSERQKQENKRKVRRRDAKKSVDHTWNRWKMLLMMVLEAGLDERSGKLWWNRFLRRIERILTVLGYFFVFFFCAVLSF
jgi:hypothetical protein